MSDARPTTDIAREMRRVHMTRVLGCSPSSPRCSCLRCSPQAVQSRSQFDSFMAELDGSSASASVIALHSTSSSDLQVPAATSPHVIKETTVAACQPEIDVMRPLPASTLEQHFPQLASFDLYLHSEIE